MAETKISLQLTAVKKDHYLDRAVVTSWSREGKDKILIRFVVWFKVNRSLVESGDVGAQLGLGKGRDKVVRIGGVR